jgi:hypothetical protein
MYYVNLNGKLKSYKRFKAQSRRIERLYLVSLYAYEGTLDSLNKELKLEKINYSDDMFFDNHLVARSPAEMKKNLKKKYRIVLRESLFVRLISLLEIYLGDTLKELSNCTTEPFMSENKKKYNISYLLSLDNIKEIQDEIINKEIRNIISNGFKSIRKFYSKNLEIDFSKSGVNMKILQQMHDMRHLFVHNNGKTDEYYKHKYNVSDKKIQLTEEFFLNSFKLLSNLADFIYKSLNDSFDLPQKKSQTKKSQKAINIHRKYKILFSNKKYISEFLDVNSLFGFDKKYKLIEILDKIEYVSDSKVIVTVKGDKKLLGTYGGFIKKLERDGFVENFIEQVE